MEILKKGQEEPSFSKSKLLILLLVFLVIFYFLGFFDFIFSIPYRLGLMGLTAHSRLSNPAQSAAQEGSAVAIPVGGFSVFYQENPNAETGSKEVNYIFGAFKNEAEFSVEIIPEISFLEYGDYILPINTASFTNRINPGKRIDFVSSVLGRGVKKGSYSAFIDLAYRNLRTGQPFTQLLIIEGPVMEVSNIMDVKALEADFNVRNDGRFTVSGEINENLILPPEIYISIMKYDGEKYTVLEGDITEAGQNKNGDFVFQYITQQKKYPVSELDINSNGELSDEFFTGKYAVNIIFYSKEGSYYIAQGDEWDEEEPDSGAFLIINSEGGLPLDWKILRYKHQNAENYIPFSTSEEILYS